jgi:hypothetical protein
MNKRLIVIGNGFDRAHGLPTAYNDFMLWLFQKTVKDAVGIPNSAILSNNYIDIVRNRFSNDFKSEKQLTSLKQVQDNLIPGTGDEYTSQGRFAEHLVHIHIKSNFIARLLQNALLDDPDWADIEKAYYRSLLAIVKNGSLNRTEKKRQVVLLNKTLNFLKDNLAEYLRSLPIGKKMPEYDSIINSGVLANLQCFLSFNYTNTHENYLRYMKSSGPIAMKTKSINIHGSIFDLDQNPLIFGYGDEVDKHYKDLQDEDMNCILDNIKSIGYFKTRNYDGLTTFINSQYKFDVYIFGHSLGLSDRTLLHQIFNHPNCRLIKIFYFEKDGKSNYTELTQEITRHFYNTDFTLMRERVAKFPDSGRMPQWNDNA